MDQSEKNDDHLVDLCEGWKLWRLVCLRGTGFPVQRLDGLTFSQAPSAVKKLIDQEKKQDNLFNETLQKCEENLRAASSGEELKKWRKIKRKLIKKKLPADTVDEPVFQDLLRTLEREIDATEKNRLEAGRIYSIELQKFTNYLLDTVKDPFFREAVIWQNRQTLKRVSRNFTASNASKRNSRFRKNEQLLTNYLQRYCTKNESIGYFGPVGWGSWSENETAIILKPGKSLILKRDVHFEYWAIQAMAKKISEMSDFRFWLPPRRSPLIRVENNRVRTPFGKSYQKVYSEVLVLFMACDGVTTAKKIAENLSADPTTKFTSPLQVLNMLNQLAAQGVIIWRLEVPMVLHPENFLRQQLEKIEDVSLQKRLLAPLASLEEQFQAVAKAGGDPDVLDEQMEKLATLFENITDQPALRNPGVTYGGRTLVYEDCERNVELIIGAEIIDQLRPALTPVLQSARWYSYEISRNFYHVFKQIYHDASKRTGKKTISLDRINKRLHIAGYRIIRGAADELVKRWESILAIDPASRRLELDPDSIRGAVQKTFSAPCPGWSYAQIHTPDIMIAASSVDDIRRGNYRLVLGEFHACINTLMQSAMLRRHPDPDMLINNMFKDDAGAQIFSVPDVNRPKGQRLFMDSFSPELQLAHDFSPSLRPPEEVLPISSLVVVDSGEGLVIRTYDGKRSWPVIDFFTYYLVGYAGGNFNIKPGGRHVPRISFGETVVCHETWRFTGKDFEFLKHKKDFIQYVAIRKWAEEHKMPRWIFVKPSTERKPIFVDLESGASVELFYKMILAIIKEDSESVFTISEMMPSPEQAWLVDAEGQNYTSELRTVVVDPVSWRQMQEIHKSL